MILLFRPEVGHDDAVGAGAMESAGPGAAVSHRAVLACREERPATAQNQHRLGAADDATSVSLQAAHLRKVETNPANYHAAASGFLAEIDRMQLEVREYLSTHPAELAAMA